MVGTTELTESEAESASHARREAQPEASTEIAETRSHVEQALAALPEEYREVIVLRDLVGLSNEEVADALELAVAAAKSRIHRGRMQLRTLLEPLADD